MITFSCAVDNNKGLILVMNMTDEPITNIKVGNQLLMPIQLPSNYFNSDYWFFSDFEGNLRANNVELLNDDPILKYKVGYQYRIFITSKKGDGKNYFEIYMYGEKSTEDINDDDHFDNPID